MLSTSSEPATEGAAIDPVCGMTVQTATAKHMHEDAGTTYYFCSARCKSRFAEDPVRFLDPSRKAAADSFRFTRTTPAQTLSSDTEAAER